MENYDKITYIFAYILYLLILIGFGISWDSASYYFRQKDKIEIHIIILICFIMFMAWLYGFHFDWCLHNVQKIVNIFTKNA